MFAPDDWAGENPRPHEIMNTTIDEIRSAMPAVTNRVYLNTGSVGPVAREMQEAMQAASDYEFEYGRASINDFMRVKEKLPRLRTLMGNVINAPEGTIALTHHTTEGMNIVIHGLQWQAGDEMLVTNWEHPGGYLPAFVAAREHGLRLNTAMLDWEDSPAQVREKIVEALTPQTRLVLLSHVMWNTGLRLPLAQIVKDVHEHGAFVLVDGAQSGGAIPIDVQSSGVDFYAITGQKWLCGPEGLGALYVRPDRMGQIHPHWVGFSSMMYPSKLDYAGYFIPNEGARRFETGTIYRPAVFAMLNNLEWLNSTVTWGSIYNRIEGLAGYAWYALKDMGATMITQPNAGSGLITFNIDDHDPKVVTKKLLDQDIVVRWLADPYALRIATGFYNNEADIDQLVDALKVIKDASG